MSTTNDDLRPQFWVLRAQTNSMVPLIALDELPPTISIRGVARSLEAKDLTGMTCAGAADSRHRTYIVDLPNKPIAIPIRAAPPSATGLGLNDSLFAQPTYHPTNPNIFPQPPKAYGISEQMPSHTKSAVTGNIVPLTTLHLASLPNAPFTAPLRVDRNPGPNLLPPWHDASSIPMKAAPGVKEYCSFWLRCGECDYAQQGCLYKHEMPLDRDVLKRLGHRDIPKWYRDKHGLGSFLAGGGGAGGIAGEKGERMERSWRNANVREERERAVKEEEEKKTMSGKSEGRGLAKENVKRTMNKERGSGAGVRSGNGRNVDKRATAWREEWEKKGDGRFAPKGSDKGAASTMSPVSSPTVSSPPPAKKEPAAFKTSTSSSSTKPRGGPASRAALGILEHYQSPVEKRLDEACLLALEADRYAKAREKEEMIRMVGRVLLVPELKRTAKVQAKVENTPETSSEEDGSGRV